MVQKQSVVGHFDDLARWLQNRNRPPASLFDWPLRCNVRWKSVRNCRLPIFVLLQPERREKLNVFALTNDFSAFGKLVASLLLASPVSLWWPYVKLEYSSADKSFRKYCYKIERLYRSLVNGELWICVYFFKSKMDSCHCWL